MSSTVSDAEEIDETTTASTDDQLLEVEDINSYYGKSHILEGVSLSVGTGEVVALLGRNGVGKTTTLRSILQLTAPETGSVRFRGEELTGLETHQVADLGIGWVPEERRMFKQLTVEENLRIAVPKGNDTAAGLERVYDKFPDIEERKNAKANHLSGGQQQMVSIARGLLGDNDLLLIDEPSEGLAPQIISTVAETIADISTETTVLLVEQNLPLALDLSDRFYILDHGQVVHAGESTPGIIDDDEIRGYLST
jgi:branched-chain amino acid transport system ATP-binding protein